MAILLESEVDGEPFSGTFFSASGSDPLGALAASHCLGRGSRTHPPSITHCQLYQHDKEMWLIANPPLLTSPLRGQSRLLLRPGSVAQTLVRPEPELGTLLPNQTKMRLLSRIFRTSL